MKLIVGLGNPEPKYDKTFHNVGFMAADYIAGFFDVKAYKTMCKAVVAETFYNGEKIFIAKPLTYMNLSGLAVKELKNKYKLNTSDIIIISDDIDLPLAKIRHRNDGSAGTHNGLKNIIQELGETNFHRIRIGIGRDEKFFDLADYVLSKIPQEKLLEIKNSFEQVKDIIIKIIGE